MNKILLGLAALIFIGCSYTDELPTTNPTPPDMTVQPAAVEVIRDGEEVSQPDICGEPDTVNLIAGKQYDAADIIVSNCEEKLYITVETDNMWKIAGTHLHVAPKPYEGAEWSVFPLNAPGNPKVGHFATKHGGDPAVKIEYIFDLSDFEWHPDTEDTTLMISLHAEVFMEMENDADFYEHEDSMVDMRNEEMYDHDVRGESAWSFGTSFPGRSWAMYFTYDLQECAALPE